VYCSQSHILLYPSHMFYCTTPSHTFLQDCSQSHVFTVLLPVTCFYRTAPSHTFIQDCSQSHVFTVVLPVTPFSCTAHNHIFWPHSHFLVVILHKPRLFYCNAPSHTILWYCPQTHLFMPFFLLCSQSHLFTIMLDFTPFLL